MKYSYKKDEKTIYNVSKKIQVLEIEPTKYITIEGIGNPNNAEFSEKIQALYKISYTLKMKIAKAKENYFDYVVYPLEGFWTLLDPSKGFSKQNLKYKIMIKQPDFLVENDFDNALNLIDEDENIKLLKFEIIDEGAVIQTTHIGDFDSEQLTFDRLNEYIKENDLEISTKMHKEIYMSDFRKTKPENLKTILRYSLKTKN